jgi:hypothetical protein
MEFLESLSNFILQRYIASCQGRNAAPSLLRHESTAPDSRYAESSAAHEVVENHNFSLGVQGPNASEVVALSNHQASDANAYAVQATGSHLGDGQPNHVYRLILRLILKLGGLGVVAVVRFAASLACFAYFMHNSLLLL